MPIPISALDKNQNSKQVPTIEWQNEGLYKHSMSKTSA
jgi:hypothetical protein